MTVNDLSTGPGALDKITIALSNSDPVTGFQFTLQLPNGLIVKEREATFVGRNTNHVLYPKNQGNGRYLFIGFSATNDTFSGNSGAIIEIPVEVPLSFTPGQTFDATLSDVIVSSSAGEDIGSNHQNGVLTIVEGKNPDLIVDTIRFQATEIVPGDAFELNWNVRNIGEAIAIGGWREQLYISAENSDQEYLIGTENFSGDVPENQAIARNATLEIPSVIGFDGSVKIKIELVPYASVKETPALQLNNTSFSDARLTLLKKMVFTIDRSEIVKNSGDKIRAHISRSGNVAVEEVLVITASDAENFETPITITLEKDQYANFGYISLKENTAYTGDTEVVLTASGADYEDQTNRVTLIEDTEIGLSITYPDTYDSSIGSTIVYTLIATDSNPLDTSIAIRSDAATRLQLPETIVLPAGATTTTFEGTILDPGIVAKRTTATLYATATNYVTASKEMVLQSVNVPDFALTLAPDKVSEGDGINATFATLKRTQHTDKEVTVTIAVDQNERLITPNDLIFEAGELEKRFNIGTIDNGSVEGDQLLTVSSKVKFSECNCTDGTDPTTISNASLTVIDNDGLALTVVASPSTIKAGKRNNSLTIRRNATNPTILENPVTVTLSSDLPSVVSLPTQVTIPANEDEVTVTFDTVINPDLTGDQNIRIEATATDYSTGFAWILVTDQNLPDVIISELQVPSAVEAGTKLAITSKITNQGYADFDSGAKIAYYLSPNNSTAGIEPFSTSILPVSIAAGTTYDFVDEVALPVQSGVLNLLVVINKLNAVTELSVANNQNYTAIELLPAYTVSVAVDKEVYLSGETVQISGTATTSKDEVVPTSDVEITVQTPEFSRVFTATTNDNGAFVYEFTPLENEAGSYVVKASYPGAEVPAQETFDILGFELVNTPRYIKWEPFVGFPLGKELTLKNPTSVPFTDVQIHLPETADFTLEQMPVSIAAGATATIGFTLVATNASTENQYTEIPITITAAEGAVYKEVVYYYSKIKQANLVAVPIRINTTMAKDTTRLYEFIVRNTGDVDANAVEVLLPSLPWLALKSPQHIDVIKAGEEAKIILELSPTATEQVNIPISGTLVLKGDNTNGITVPFRIETVSEATGAIEVDATDEYTYNTASAPHLAGATVQIKHPYTGAVLAEGVTNSDGLFEVPEINEGYYTVSVKAPKHNPYQNTILVDPGKTTYVNAFMQYQAVTYNWEVVPTEITDEYDISLVTQFETNVPKPVVVMELDNTNLDLEAGASRLLNLTITNHGLIAANRVKLGTTEIEGYELKPLITTMDTLRAKATVVVPVLLKRNAINKLQAKRQTRTTSDPCPQGSITFEAYYPCNQDEKIFSFAAVYDADCDGPSGNLGISVDIGPGYPTGFGTGGDTLDPYSGGAFTPTSFPDLCDACTKEVVTTAIKCAPQTALGDAALCAIGLGTATSWKELKEAFKNCKKKAKKKVKCITLVKDAIKTCVKQALGSNKRVAFTKNASVDKWDFILDDLEKIEAADDALIAKMDAYLQNPTLRQSEELLVFMEQVSDNLDAKTIFTAAAIAAIKQNLEDTTISSAYIDTFTIRWNTTVRAWDQGVFSPNATFPDIIDYEEIKEYDRIIGELVPYTTSRGFVSAEEMYTSAIENVEEYQKAKEQEEASVCATVTIEFPQRLTMTREAFEGTLTINNSSDKSIKNITLDLIVKNEIGEHATDLFQINKDTFLDGTGVVSPNSTGSGVAIFIPGKNAAPQVKQSYSFGGILSYFDEDLGETVSITLNPVTLEVNPSPDLILDYFLQRDIIGDDPLTEQIVEPSIPAELSLMITNDGFGEAKNVSVESMQPRIIENEKGLAIDFEMIGSSFNNQPKQLGLLAVDFGTINPKSSSIGQWYFTSSLMGHFVSYDIEVNHKSNYTNEALSLIKEANVHELIKSVQVYQEGSDALPDFLVNDIADAHDTPDRLFYSDGTSEAVISAENVTASNEISGTNLTTTITVAPFTTGWNYGVIADPGTNRYRIASIVRDTDGVEIPLSNFWQTSVTLRDGLNPKYENKLHVLDQVSEVTTYTVSYISRDLNTPAVVAIEGVPEDESTATPVALLTVRFSKEIDVNTFTTDAITLIRQGEQVAKEDILIGKIDATTYSITLQDVTQLSGYYELTISSVGIQDVEGNTGENAMRVNWIQFLDELGILTFESDQVKKLPINSVTVTFNKPIRSEEFTNDKITMNGNPINNDVVIAEVDDFRYTITGLDVYNQENNTYVLDINLPELTAADGSKGLIQQSYQWVVDKELPAIAEIIPIHQGGIHAQNITELSVRLTKKLANPLEETAFTFYKNGQRLEIPIIVQQIEDTTYTIFGLGAYTEENGNYEVTIDQGTFVDENENIGIGLANTTWTVNRVQLDGLATIRIVPDIGIAADDLITAGTNIELVYETLEDNLTVEVYELLATSEVLAYEHLRATTGTYRIPLVGKLGSKRFKLIATDANGNRSAPTVVSMYIDFTDIETTIEAVKEVQDVGCYDFDYVEVSFSEAIVDNTFTHQAITLKSSGIEIPKNDVVFTKINDQKYRLENIDYDGDGEILLEIDKTKITKQTSGMSGISMDTKALGVPNKYEASVEGERNPILDEVYTYTATANLNKYDWFVINGEIITTAENTVSIKWTQVGELSLVLRYQTPFECNASVVTTIVVEDHVLTVDEQQTPIQDIRLAPVPNNGQFSIHTNRLMGDTTIEIRSVAGQLVYREEDVNFDTTVKNINISGIPSGIYILVLSNQEEKVDFKFVIDN